MSTAGTTELAARALERFAVPVLGDVPGDGDDPHRLVEDVFREPDLDGYYRAVLAPVMPGSLHPVTHVHPGPQPRQFRPTD